MAARVESRPLVELLFHGLANVMHGYEALATDYRNELDQATATLRGNLGPERQRQVNEFIEAASEDATQHFEALCGEGG